MLVSIGPSCNAISKGNCSIQGAGKYNQLKKSTPQQPPPSSNMWNLGGLSSKKSLPSIPTSYSSWPYKHHPIPYAPPVRWSTPWVILPNLKGPTSVSQHTPRKPINGWEFGLRPGDKPGGNGIRIFICIYIYMASFSLDNDNNNNNSDWWWEILDNLWCLQEFLVM